MSGELRRLEVLLQTGNWKQVAGAINDLIVATVDRRLDDGEPKAPWRDCPWKCKPDAPHCLCRNADTSAGVTP
jgi:hypothetical protein